MITLLNSTTLLRPNQDRSFAAATLAYKKRIISNGGTISDSSLLAFDNFYKELLGAGLVPKIRRLCPILGNDDNACRTPAIANIGNNLVTDISGTNTWVESTGINITIGSQWDEGINADVTPIIPTSNLSFGYYYRADADASVSHNSFPSTIPSYTGVSIGTQRGNTGAGATFLTGQGPTVEALASFGSSTNVYGYFQSSMRYDVASPAGSVDIYLYQNGTLLASALNGTPSSVYTETTRPVILNGGTTASDKQAGYCIGEFLNEAESAAMATAWNNFQAEMGRSPY